MAPIDNGRHIKALHNVCPGQDKDLVLYGKLGVRAAPLRLSLKGVPDTTHLVLCNSTDPTSGRDTEGTIDNNLGPRKARMKQLYRDQTANNSGGAGPQNDQGSGAGPQNAQGGGSQSVASGNSGSQ